MGRKQPKAHRYPGLGLLTVAALCSSDVNVQLIDDDFEEINYRDETDLVGISVLTPNAFRAYEISRKFRDRRVPVVLGGLHVSACPTEASINADAVVLGEAEDTWPELLRDFEKGKLRKIYRSTNNSDLANLPFPRRSLLKRNKYITVNTVQAARGCRFNCEFCCMTSLFGSKIRCRPVEEVVEEIRSLGGRSFLLNDDNIAQMSGYYQELFLRLIPLKKRWIAQASWNIGSDAETLDLLEKSGCRGLAIGFESLVPQQGVKKIVSSPVPGLLYKEVIKELHDRNITVLGNFVFGFDHEDESTFEKILAFTLESQLDVVQLYILTPYPGTGLFNRLKAEGRILDENWSRYVTSNLCFELKTMPREVFLKKYAWLKKRLHSYPLIARRVVRAAKRLTPFELGILLGINLGNRTYLRSPYLYS